MLIPPSGTGEDWNEMSNDDPRGHGPTASPGPVPPGAAVPRGAGVSPGAAPGLAPHPARLSVGVVGAGRVGSVLAAALGRAGHRIAAVSAVSDGSVRRIRRNLPGVPVLAPDQVLARADLVLLTVPDDVLPALVAGLASAGAPMRGRLLAHASGRHGLAVLEPAVRRGALPLALHPVMTFTGRPDDIDKLAGICFGVTAPEPLQPAAEALVVEMGGEPVLIAEELRDLYHAALDNALRLGDAALTGPVARGDADTVASHIQALRTASPEAVAAYVALARLTADRALAAGSLAAADAQRLLDVLAGAPQ